MTGSETSSAEPIDDIGAAMPAAFRLFRHNSPSGDGLACWVALPEHIDPSASPLVAVHGIHRDARTQAMVFGLQSVELGRVVIAPVFRYRHWQGYQQVYGKRRADLGLLALLDQLSASLRIDVSRFDLFGYSGGAQFAHRFALAYPHRIRELHLLAAGWYSFPDAEPYPYGLGPPVSPVPGYSPLLKASLGHFLSLPIRVYVGEHDNDIDEHVRSSAALDRQQGPNRLVRGQRWVAALREVAQARGLDPDIDFHVLRDCGHDFKTCAGRGGLIKTMLRTRSTLLNV